MKDHRWCKICKPKNPTIYFHNENNVVWLYCCKCARGYTFAQYCELAGLSVEEGKNILRQGVVFEDDINDEINALAWPSSYIPLSDPRAEQGVSYIKSRGLTLDGDMYYDLAEEAIVFPYYYQNYFCGAQIRFVNPRELDNGKIFKISTLPGSRLKLLFYGWNQSKLLNNISSVIVTEGAFNTLAINQSLNLAYGSVTKNPSRSIASSGAALSQHQEDALKELVDQGKKVILASDTDEAGEKMLNKAIRAGCITHYAFTDSSDCDWNDVVKEIGHKDFAKYFLQQVKPI
jgi:hypothetical protein